MVTVAPSTKPSCPGLGPLSHGVPDAEKVGADASTPNAPDAATLLGARPALSATACSTTPVCDTVTGPL